MIWVIPILVKSNWTYSQEVIFGQEYFSHQTTDQEESTRENLKAFGLASQN